MKRWIRCHCEETKKRKKEKKEKKKHTKRKKTTEVRVAFFLMDTTNVGRLSLPPSLAFFSLPTSRVLADGRNEKTHTRRKRKTVRGKVPKREKTKRSGGENRQREYADRTERDRQTNVTTEKKEREIERRTEEN